MNSQYYFVQGITWSDAGFYSPTIRLSGQGVFDVKGSRMVIKEDAYLDVYSALGLLCSRLLRLLIKAISNHTVSTQVDDFREMPVPIESSPELTRIKELVQDIIREQQVDPRYAYHLNEQKQIDRLVYGLYRLSETDIREVELWYCRRYPALAEAQGLTEEVKQKYRAHLERCERLLSKPPSYWRSNPILELIAQGESHTQEFKETLEYDVRQNQRNADVLKSSLKTIAAFLNAEGGTLLIGVSDAGEVKGLDRDYSCMNRGDRDRFEQKVRNCLRDRFGPSQLGTVDVSFDDLAEWQVCRIDVRPADCIVHLDNEVYVRDGNRSLKLEGQQLTDWIQRRTAQLRSAQS